MVELAAKLGRRKGGGYTSRVRQLLADLVSFGEAFGIREIRLHDSYLYSQDAQMAGEDLPDDRTIARVLWRFARDGELRQVNSGRGQGKRALYVKGPNWEAAQRFKGTKPIQVTMDGETYYP